MLWFSNTCVSPIQFVGLHCGLHEGAYILTLVLPDGCQEAKTFHDEEAMFEGAMKIHCALVMRGWQVCPHGQPQPASTV